MELLLLLLNRLSINLMVFNLNVWVSEGWHRQSSNFLSYKLNIFKIKP